MYILTSTSTWINKYLLRLHSETSRISQYLQKPNLEHDLVLSIQWCDHIITQRYFSEQHSQTPYPQHSPFIYGFSLCEHLHSDLKGKKSCTVSWGAINCLRLKNKQTNTHSQESLSSGMPHFPHQVQQHQPCHSTPTEQHAVIALPLK